MIAECRALGQGLILAEQSASKIDPNVLINTSTKIVHTVLYGEDKEYLSSALSLSEAERDYLAYLPVGEALAFTPASYQPIHVRIPEFRS
jgi:DNA helicase HerA-like ATPase